MLSWQLGDAKKSGDCGSGGKEARTVAAAAAIDWRRGGRDALVSLLAAASLVQLCALAAGGAWVLLRLQALEASHERLRATCVARDSIPHQRAAAEDVRGGSGGGGVGGDEVNLGEEVAAAAAAGDHVHGGQNDDFGRELPLVSRSFPWKRSVAHRGEEPTLHRSQPDDAPPQPPLAQNTDSGVAHFEFRPRVDEFFLYRNGSYTVMALRRADHSDLRDDRWYPVIQQYDSAAGTLMHLARAAWLGDGSGSEPPPMAWASALGVITVSEDGVYLIYAQVCFVDLAPVAGFVIKKTTFADRASVDYVASCETVSRGSESASGYRRRTTCPVTTVHKLSRHDRLTIEFSGSRRIFVRHDYTFVGLVRVA